jgi:hypothetical protein
MCDNKIPKSCNSSIYSEYANNIDKKENIKIILSYLGNLEITDNIVDVIIKLKDIHEKVQNAPFDRILEMKNENDDADTADVILQSVFFGEVIYG